MIDADVGSNHVLLHLAAVNGRLRVRKRMRRRECFFCPQKTAASACSEAKGMTTIDILQASARDLQQRAEEHRRLIAAAIEKNDVKCLFEACHLLGCSHKQELKGILLEVISVLEDTRKAFKSRQLEALRKKMIRILAEAS
jgi:hypothetical protein